MLFTLFQQLDNWSKTLRLVADVAGAVEPGRQVDLQILSTAKELVATDNVLGIQILSSPTQLLAQLPVRMKVTWEVFDQNGQELDVGKDFLANNGLEGPLVSFVFSPPFVELGVLDSEAPKPVEITIRASVILELQRVDSTPPTLITFPALDPSTGQPRLPLVLELKLPLVPLEIPTFLALFRHDKFRPFTTDMTPGFALLVGKSNSPLQALSQVTNDLLKRIEDVLRPLRAIVKVADFLTGLTILSQALGAQPMVRMVNASIEHLRNIHMRTDTFLGFDIFNPDLRANDKISSLILIGPPGTKAQCFSDKDFKTGQGSFTVETGATMITFIKDLHTDLVGLPGVSVVEDDDDDNRFGDSMTSVKFL